MAQQKQQNLREMANEIDRVIEPCLSTALDISSKGGIHLTIYATEKFQQATNAARRESRAEQKRQVARIKSAEGEAA